MRRSLRSCEPWAAACVLVVAAVACESSDTIAPEGATIDMSASPAQIVLDSNNVQTSPVLILATVRSGIGVPLAGQDVRFTTNTGNLTFPGTGTPAAGVPVETDDDGNARVELNGATTSATISATSGKAADTLNLTAAKGEIAQILLSVPIASFTSCSDMISMTATVLDSDGMPVEDVSISFETITSGAPQLSFTNNPKLTDANGEVPSVMTFNPTSDCQTKCGNPKDCSFTIQAKTTGGSFTSNRVNITDLVDQ